jgi:hypothetical protein
VVRVLEAAQKSLAAGGGMVETGALERQVAMPAAG